ncbi:unnamed protein product [Gordionus sp. m RMFG-2023]|uniref:large ribosomal subunit protein bL19m-like n=1 Tax=Gordionus sp. m RMFG-2023 TaxID=3053472 RepID=UPI0030E4ABC3
MRRNLLKKLNLPIIKRLQLVHKYYGIPMDDTDLHQQDSSKITKEYRFIYPEFLPNNNDWTKRNKLCEMLERKDMIKRRMKMVIPEFYVGTIMSVTVADPYAEDKINKFMGVCILRGEHGMRHFFILRNIIDNLGVEVSYEMYNPTILSIDIIKLEKRLDDHLLYLRDALPEYSTFDVNMPKVFHSANDPVPVNPLKVTFKPKPWEKRWERCDLRGVQDYASLLSEKDVKRKKKYATPWEKFDIMKEYRAAIPKEEQEKIFEEIKLKEKEDSYLKSTSKKVYKS